MRSISNLNVQTNRLLILICYIVWMLYYINCFIENDCCLNYISISIRILPYCTICLLQFWKILEKSLGSAVMYIGSCMSTTQKNVLFKLKAFKMKAFTRPQRVPDSYENITVKIRFIHFEHLKKDQRCF